MGCGPLHGRAYVVWRVLYPFARPMANHALMYAVLCVSASTPAFLCDVGVVKAQKKVVQDAPAARGPTKVSTHGLVIHSLVLRCLGRRPDGIG